MDVVQQRLPKVLKINFKKELHHKFMHPPSDIDLVDIEKLETANNIKHQYNRVVTKLLLYSTRGTYGAIRRKMIDEMDITPASFPSLYMITIHRPKIISFVVKPSIVSEMTLELKDINIVHLQSSKNKLKRTRLEEETVSIENDGTYNNYMSLMLDNRAKNDETNSNMIIIDVYNGDEH